MSRLDPDESDHAAYRYQQSPCIDAEGFALAVRDLDEAERVRRLDFLGADERRLVVEALRRLP